VQRKVFLCGGLSALAGPKHQIWLGISRVVPEPGPADTGSSVPVDTLTSLYNNDAGLIQQKASHILTIRLWDFNS